MAEVFIPAFFIVSVMWFSLLPEATTLCFVVAVLTNMPLVFVIHQFVLQVVTNASYMPIHLAYQCTVGLTNTQVCCLCDHHKFVLAVILRFLVTLPAPQASLGSLTETCLLAGQVVLWSSCLSISQSTLSSSCWWLLSLPRLLALPGSAQQLAKLVVSHLRLRMSLFDMGCSFQEPFIHHLL